MTAVANLWLCESEKFAEIDFEFLCQGNVSSITKTVVTSICLRTV